jgi:hypothetical protein
MEAANGRIRIGGHRHEGGRPPSQRIIDTGRGTATEAAGPDGRPHDARRHRRAPGGHLRAPLRVLPARSGPGEQQACQHLDRHLRVALRGHPVPRGRRRPGRSDIARHHGRSRCRRVPGHKVAEPTGGLSLHLRVSLRLLEVVDARGRDAATAGGGVQGPSGSPRDRAGVHRRELRRWCRPGCGSRSTIRSGRAG